MKMKHLRMLLFILLVQTTNYKVFISFSKSLIKSQILSFVIMIIFIRIYVYYNTNTAKHDVIRSCLRASKSGQNTISKHWPAGFGVWLRNRKAIIILQISISVAAGDLCLCSVQNTEKPNPSTPFSRRYLSLPHLCLYINYSLVI